ncbi:MAG TPA: L-erythro-3,5-diaminohexanoate dehydrogenase, partial [Rubrivivax sp.]|nr:L-erythro-3,5-diaminohexanoate dehydrogenase [Rubrivivax sp.]
MLEPAGVLPQAAWKLDASMRPAANEVLIDVRTLNIDSASFTQIKREVGAAADAIAARVREIVAARGKMHNPVTGSGGMLIGTVRAVGQALA